MEVPQLFSVKTQGTCCKGLFTHNVLLASVCYDHRFEMCSYYYHQINGEKMGLAPILAVIYTVTIGTTLNFNSGNEGHRLKTLRVNRP